MARSSRSARSATMRMSMPGRSRTSADTSEPAQDLDAAPLVGRAERPRRSCRAPSPTARRRRSGRDDSSSRKWPPGSPPAAAARPATPPRSLGQIRPGRRTHSTSMSAPSRLRRAPGPPQQPLRARLRASTSTRIRSGMACCGERVEHAARAGRSTSSDSSRRASWRSASSFSGRKKFASAVSTRLLRVDLARPQPLAGAPAGRGRPARPRRPRPGCGRGTSRARARPSARRHGVVQALQVLDVDGRDHVDAGVEHLVDVLVALVVAQAGGVRVRELVDQRQLGRARGSRRRCPSPQRDAAVLGLPARHRSSPSANGDRVRAIVRLEVADHDVESLAGAWRPSWSIR